MSRYFCYSETWGDIPGEVIDADSKEKAAEKYCKICSDLDFGTFSIAVKNFETEEYNVVLVEVGKSAVAVSLEES
jgi:hypothetical protein